MSLKEIWKATKDALLGLMTCIIIVGGVILGWFTATESAAVAVVYAFIVTFFVYREIPRGSLVTSCGSPCGPSPWSWL